ncbi:plasmid transfer protein, partial [Streptomyces termitum]
GGWSRIRTPELSAAEVADICTAHADLTPDLPALAAYRPVLPDGISADPAPVPLVKPNPATA